MKFLQIIHHHNHALNLPLNNSGQASEKTLLKLFFIRAILFCLFLFAASGSFAQTPSASPVTQLSIGGTGDFIGGTRSYFYGQGVGVYRVITVADFSKDGLADNVYILFDAQTPTGEENWSFEFKTNRSGRNLVPGYFENAERAGFEADGKIGMAISGNGKGCNTSRGNFTIHEAQYNMTGAQPQLLKLTVSFEQYCEGQTKPLIGTLYYNYSGEAPTYTLSGRVSTPGGAPLSGATVALSGSQTLTATTDAGGNYSFAGLLEGGYFLLRPSAPGYTFTPQSAYFPRLSASQTVDFGNVALYGISGRVLRPNGTALNGMQVILSGSRQSSVFTDAGGNYSFADLPADGNYTVTPFHQNYQFTPPNQTFNTLSANQIVNFTGIIQVFSITGKVTNQAGTPASNVPVMLSGPQGNQMAFTNASGTYVFTTLARGTYTVDPFPTADFYTYSPRSKTITDLSANQTINFIGLTVPARKTLFDYDGDGRADISLFRPSNTYWYIANSAGAVSYTQFGLSTDKIVPADYDGDGKTDIAVYRPENGTWYIMRSSGGVQYVQFGLAEDYPMPADFNGDGKAEIAVYRPSSGLWFILNSDTQQYSVVQFGVSEDLPVAADYNGDGKSEIAVYRPSLGIWFIYNSDTKQYTSTKFGISTDKPVPADYNGDGKTDIAIYRPNEGNWYISTPTGNGYTVTQFGLSTDLPTPADYDGDGKTDIAVYRPNEGNWYQLKSKEGFGIIRFGLSEDKPTPNVFVY